MTTRQANIWIVSATILTAVVTVFIYYLDKKDDQKDVEYRNEIQKKNSELDEKMTSILLRLTELLVQDSLDSDALSHLTNSYDSIVALRNESLIPKKKDSIELLIKKLKNRKSLKYPSDSDIEVGEDSTKNRTIWN